MTELEKLCREAYGAYEYLRDHDLSAESGTSKRLRSGDINKLKARLIEEIHELKGVIEGTHFHEGFEKDIILEGYEVWYWAASLMVAQHFSYNEIQPDESFEVGFQRPVSERDNILKSLPDLILRLQTSDSKDQAIKLFDEVLQFIGFACALNQTLPSRLLERDLEEMRQKVYLTEYWQKVDDEIGPEEMADVLEAIAESEVEEKTGFYITQHQINETTEQMISERESKTGKLI